MKIPFLADHEPETFRSPTALPSSDEEANQWQINNQNWWESHPMRYDFDTPLPETEFTRPFFLDIDKRFLRNAEEEYPSRSIPFDGFIDYEALGSLDVLEIGVGCGTHAQLLSSHSRSYTGIDQTTYAVRATTARLRLAGSTGRILQMDAEKMTFPDASFDFVWTWGVIHHSADTVKILSEIARVLRPGGRCTVMVYHRSLWNWLFRGVIYYGLLRGGFFRTRSVHKLMQETTDGALARYYTVNEWQRTVESLFAVKRAIVLGHRSQLLPLPWGPLKERLSRLIPLRIGRWITNRPFFGYMLVAEMEKKAGD